MKNYFLYLTFIITLALLFSCENKVNKEQLTPEEKKLVNQAIKNAGLEEKADVNAKNKDGYTALLFATSRRSNTNNQLPTVKALIKAGANVNATDNVGNTPLHLAVTFSENSNSEAIIEELIKAGANVNATDNVGITPLHYLGSPAIIKTLIKAGADVNAKDHDGNTPLHYLGSPAIIKTLIKAGADVNTKNNYRETPLHYAIEEHSAKWNNKSTIQALVNAGADLYAENNDGETSLSLAIKRSIEHLLTTP